MKNFLKINRALVAKKKLTFLLTFLCLSAGVWADYVDYISLTSLDSYTQDFNGIGGENVTEAMIAAAPDGKRSVEQSTTLPNGWKVEANKTAPRTIGGFSGASSTTTYVGGTNMASTAKNGTWNFGATESTDRAIGGLTTSINNGTRGINVMAHLHNNTGLDINSIALNYDIEKYRNGSNAAGFTVALYTSTDGSTWTSAGDPFSTSYSADGSTAGAAEVPISSTAVNGLLKVSFPANGDLYLAWNISVSSGNDCSGAQGLAIDNVSITPMTLASNELFATYQKHGETLYEGEAEANLEATSHTLAVNYYIVSCGDSVLLRATTTEDFNFDAGWQTQLRIWTGNFNNSNQIQTNAGGGTKNCYTLDCKEITPKADDIRMHFFLNKPANSVSQTINFNRASINNPIDDNVAPVIEPNDVTMAEVDGKLVFTFGEVTADDEYFYYVGDKDHNVGSISLTNKVTIIKPTVQDGVTYKFRCYAVDYNGNKSAYKEFTLTMPFDNTLELARGKTCTAGYYNGGDVPANAVNGDNNNHWGTYGISDYSQNWWRVDLNNAYNLSEIDVELEYSNTYKIEGSMDGSSWTEILRTDAAPAASTLVKYESLSASARYLKLTALGANMISIRHFKVYATGVAAADETDPTVSVTEISKTVNSVTLQIIASDKDDAGNPGTITAINISGDNDFVTRNNVTLVENQITLSGLTYNKTYHFTVQAVDLAGNDASANIEVALPFNTDYNLSLQGTATAGYRQNEDTKSAKAIDGDAETRWNTWGVGDSGEGYSRNWMRVDLKAVYNLRAVAFSFDWHYDNPVPNYVVEGSLDDSNWYLLAHVTDQSATSANLAVNGPARYVRFRAITEQSLGIYEFEVYASGFSTLADNAPVITWAKVEAIDDSSAEIEIDAVDITTKPITKYMVSGIGEDPIEVTASEGKITLISLSQSTHYTLSIQAKDGDGNLSEAKEVELTTAGSVSGLYFFSDYFDWNKTAEGGRFSTTAEPGVLGVTISNMTASGHTFKLYNASADRCTRGDCSGTTDHHFANATAKNVTIYATDEDHFICTEDALYLRGTLVGEDQALVWNDAHTVATWSGTLDLSGTKQFNVIKKNVVGETTYTYTHDFYSEAQTFDGDYTYGTFTLDLTKMTGTWGYVGLTLDETANNASMISSHNTHFADITLSRAFIADGGNYTLCLPFNMTAEQCAEAFHTDYQLWYLEDSRLKDNGDIYLNFISADNIVAGRPYLFCPASDVASGTVISNVQIDSEASKVSSSTYASFIGTYDVIAYNVIATTTNAYLLGSDNWLFEASELNPDYNLKALRAYFTLNFQSLSVQGRRPRAMVVFNEPRTDMPTDIEDAEQVVAPAKRIVNGQLIIEKNGVLYNAQGKRLQ